MNRYINDFYTKVDIDADAVDRIIAASKTERIRRSVNKSTVFAFACVAMMVIGIFSVIMMKPGIMFSNNNIEATQIESIGNLSSGSESLLFHDGFSFWIDSSYYNGKKLYAVIKGNYRESEWKYADLPDTIKYVVTESDDAVFSVNENRVELVNKEIVLTKKDNHFEGVIELNVTQLESYISLEVSIPTMDIISRGKLITTAYGPYKMKSGVARVYCKSSDSLLNGENILYLKSIVAFPQGALSEPIAGLSVRYYVPFSDIDTKIAIYNENGDLIPVVLETQRPEDDGVLYTCLYGFAGTQNVRVVFYNTYDKDTQENIQEFEVTLNNPDEGILVFE